MLKEVSRWWVCGCSMANPFQIKCWSGEHTCRERKVPSTNESPWLGPRFAEHAGTGVWWVPPPSRDKTRYTHQAWGGGKQRAGDGPWPRAGAPGKGPERWRGISLPDPASCSWGRLCQGTGVAMSSCPP